MGWEKGFLMWKGCNFEKCDCRYVGGVRDEGLICWVTRRV